MSAPTQVHYQADGQLKLACNRQNSPGKHPKLIAVRNWNLVTCKQCLRRKPSYKTPLGAP